MEIVLYLDLGVTFNETLTRSQGILFLNHTYCLSLGGGNENKLLTKG